MDQVTQGHSKKNLKTQAKTSLLNKEISTYLISAFHADANIEVAGCCLRFAAGCRSLAACGLLLAACCVWLLAAH